MCDVNLGEKSQNAWVVGLHTKGKRGKQIRRKADLRRFKGPQSCQERKRGGKKATGLNRGKKKGKTSDG